MSVGARMVQTSAKTGAPLLYRLALAFGAFVPLDVVSAFGKSSCRLHVSLFVRLCSLF